jgi:hypothetical protein
MVCLRDPGSKLGVARIHKQWQIMLDPTRHVGTNPSLQKLCEKRPSKSGILNILTQTQQI